MFSNNIQIMTPEACRSIIENESSFCPIEMFNLGISNIEGLYKMENASCVFLEGNHKNQIDINELWKNKIPMTFIFLNEDKEGLVVDCNNLFEEKLSNIEYKDFQRTTLIFLDEVLFTEKNEDFLKKTLNCIRKKENSILMVNNDLEEARVNLLLSSV